MTLFEDTSVYVSVVCRHILSWRLGRLMNGKEALKQDSWGMKRRWRDIIRFKDAQKYAQTIPDDAERERVREKVKAEEGRRRSSRWRWDGVHMSHVCSTEPVMWRLFECQVQIQTAAPPSACATMRLRTRYHLFSQFFLRKHFPFSNCTWLCCSLIVCCAQFVSDVSDIPAGSS